MNKPSVILLLSLAANIALATLVHQRRTASVPSAAKGISPSAAAVAPSAASPALPSDARIPVILTDREFIARLRAGGMPPDLVRSLVYSRVQARYRDRINALTPPRPDEYWRSWNQSGWTAMTPEMRAQFRALSREVEAELRALLGDGPDSLSPSERRLFDQMAGRLPVAKVQQIEAIQRDYNDLAAQVRDRSRGLVLKADREQLRLLERERRNDLAAVLTPEELLEYDLRASQTADALRNRLAFFEPSEAEFRALGQLQLEFDRQFPPGDMSAEESDRRQAAARELLGRIHASLTPERFADYQVTIDGMFPETRRFVGAYELAPSVANEIVALKQQTWRRIDELQGAGLTSEQRHAALQAMEQEVESRLGGLLGPDLLPRYKRSGATWLNRLRPPPPRT